MEEIPNELTQQDTQEILIPETKASKAETKKKEKAANEPEVKEEEVITATEERQPEIAAEPTEIPEEPAEEVVETGADDIDVENIASTEPVVYVRPSNDPRHTPKPVNISVSTVSIETGFSLALDTSKPSPVLVKERIIERPANDPRGPIQVQESA